MGQLFNFADWKIDGMFVFVVVLAYFLGNISPSTLLARAKGLDIKKEGSGNAGTTNTLRVLGGKAALITLIVDIGKGVLAVLLGGWLSSPEAAMCCALAAFLGHIFPVLLKFKGGKGVAVAFGAVAAMDPKLGFLSLGIVILAVLITRRVSIGSILIAVLFPFLCWWLHPEFLPFGIVMAILLFYKHRSNLMRLIRGEEDPISLSWFKGKKGGSK